MNRRHFVLSLSAVTATLGLSQAAHAHGFHAAFSVLEVNPRTGSLEIIHRLFIQDFELALSERGGPQITLHETPETEKLVRDYLAERFVMTLHGAGAGRVLTPAWVGLELKVDTMFVYQEIVNIGPMTALEIRNAILTDTHPGQVNTVNVTVNKRTQTAIFTGANPDPQTLRF